MRDLLEDMFGGEVLDPMESARRSMRARLRRRFYAQAWAAAAEAGGHAVLLDGRPIRTPAGALFTAPTAPLAAALAAEWDAQAEVIDPAQMPLTRLSNSIIDGVFAAQDDVAAEVVRYLGSDLLFYRADSPSGLVEAQARHWDAALAWADATYDARFFLAAGVVHVAQPTTALDAMKRALPEDPWRLGAVHAVTTLTGSALLALALAGGRLSAEEVWAAAHVDEDWNMSQWGRDDLALERRKFRWQEMRAAATVLDFAAAATAQ